MRVIAAAVVSLSLSWFHLVPVHAKDRSDPSRLTVKRIFGSGEFRSQRSSARWLGKLPTYTVLENSSDQKGAKDIVGYDARSGKRELLVSAADLMPPGESSPLKIDGYAFSRDRSLVLIYTNSKRVWRRKTRGDYWIFDRTARQLRKIGGKAKPASLMFAKFSPSGKQVAFVSERSLFCEDLFDHSVKCLAKADDAHTINGTFDWVYEEELSLRDGFRWSPDGKSIAYWQINTKGVRRMPLVNNTDTLYPRITWIPYPKVGQRNSSCRVGVVSLKTGKTVWMKVPGDPREHYIARMEWAGTANSRELLVQQLNRLQNTNRVMLANAKTGTVTSVLSERDKAWVDVNNELKWFDLGKRFTWISERDGWRHVYLVSRDGKKMQLATPGKYDVIQLLSIDEKNGLLYFIASPDNPTQRFLYSIRLDGKGLKRLTPAQSRGTHSYQISAKAGWAIHTASTFDDPPTSELVQLPQHKPQRPLAENKRLFGKVQKLKRRPVEFFRVDIGGGVRLDGWCIKPPDFDPKMKYPLLVYVYGEPAGSTVTDRWGGENGLWHLLLAQRGYVVMSFDNRGAKVPRGRAWRKFVYRKIGIVSPQDQAAAVRAVIGSRSWIDSRRIGIWGWSGGGSSSLHAIFKYPDLYHTAISVAPVANQRYYDTIYQERYMGLPGGNVRGYQEGSPINFARKLKGNLLLIHGSGDDNCHYQTTELLINELIRHNKPFRLMSYPNRTHAIREGKNTKRHLRELMTRYLLEKLPPGGR
ncbi:MAG: S9 family peptidase [Planctomycetes bacterium]|nr:S9 family peptidase [Planctomycetota bacterium]